MDISGVYIIKSINKPNRAYIGSSKCISKRWKQHLHSLRENHHHSKKLQNHYNKYGEADLQFSVLLGCDKELMFEHEQYFLDSLKPYFNGQLIAKGFTGEGLSDESRQRYRLINLGRKASDETRRKMSKSQKGLKKKPMSEQGRKNISEAHKGITTWNKGMFGEKSHCFGKKRGPMPQWLKDKISLINSGKRGSCPSVPDELVPIIKDAIKNKGSKSLKQISIDYNISYYTIRDISCGKSYNNVKK